MSTRAISRSGEFARKRARLFRTQFYVLTKRGMTGDVQVLVVKTEKSKNEKKNQNHPKNKNLSDNCRAVSAHRSVLRRQSNSLYRWCPLSHGRGRGAGSFARERILLPEHRYGRMQRGCHVVRDAAGVWFLPGKILDYRSIAVRAAEQHVHPARRFRHTRS